MKFIPLLMLTFSLFLVGCNTNTKPISDEIEKTTQKEIEENVKTSTAYATTVLKAEIASPRKEMKASIGEANITVNYGSPSVKGRTLWGDLVGYDKVWRAGANEATTVTTDKELMINGETLPAGKYSFFVIPNETKEWTVIFNQVADQWGSNKYDETKDVLRTMATAVEVDELSETLDYIIDNNSLIMYWGNTQLLMSIKSK